MCFLFSIQDIPCHDRIPANQDTPCHARIPARGCPYPEPLFPTRCQNIRCDTRIFGAIPGHPQGDVPTLNHIHRWVARIFGAMPGHPRHDRTSTIPGHPQGDVPTLNRCPRRDDNRQIVIFIFTIPVCPRRGLDRVGTSPCGCPGLRGPGRRPRVLICTYPAIRHCVSYPLPYCIPPFHGSAPGFQFDGLSRMYLRMAASSLAFRIQ